MTTVAAIDPSLSNAGFAILDNDKIVLHGHQPLRTCEQIAALVAVVTLCSPDLVVIENGYVSVNAKTGLQLAELRGALRYAFLTHGISVEFVQPSAWRASTIRPPARAKRKELKALAKAHVLAHYGMTVSDDVADAVCIAEHASSSLREPA